MLKCRIMAFAMMLSLAVVIGCSGGDGMQGLVGPANEGQPPASMSGTTGTNPDVPGSEGRAPVAATSGTTTFMGLWEVVIDKEAGTIEAVDMRSSDLILNVLGFLEPPAMSGMKIDFSTLVIDSANNIVKVDVILTHPIADPAFMGFDVRGVVFGPAVTNADGLTIIPSPEFFNGVPFGYINGLLGVPDSVAHYKGLAGYKYFCKDLGLTDDLATFMSNAANLANRGVFPNGTTLRRHYDLSWAKTTPPITFLVFNYAIYANYDWPTGSAPIDLGDFDITTANSQEAFCCKVTETANSLWYSGGVGGGTISLNAQIWDWQGNVSNVKVESVDPGVMTESFFDVFMDLGPYYDEYQFINVPANPTTAGDLDLLITAIDAKTFGESWFMGLLPTSNLMYKKPVYNCWLYTTKVTACPKPTLKSVAPPNHAPDNVEFTLTINGTGFVGGASQAVTLKKTGQTDIVGTSVTYINPTQMTCKLKIPLATVLGLRDVVVVNGCGQTGTGTGLFEVVCPTPVVTAISPNTRAANGVSYSYTITGSNFAGGSSLAVALTRSGSSNINATSPAVTSPTQITCNITIPIGTVNGQWNVQVTNGCGGSPGIGTNLFTVTCPTPTVTAIVPNSHLPDGVPFSATITGNYFTAGSSLAVALTNSLAPGPINATSPSVVSTTQINCTFTIPVGTITGAWNVRVTNGCGGTPGVGTNLFTVTATSTGPKNIDLRGTKYPAWDLVVNPENGDVLILYNDLQVWRHQSSDYTKGAKFCDTKNPFTEMPGKGWIDIMPKGYFIIGLDKSLTGTPSPPMAAWTHHDASGTPVATQTNDTYHAFGDVMSANSAGVSAYDYDHFALYGQDVSKPPIYTWIDQTLETKYDPVNMTYQWSSSTVPDDSIGSLQVSLVKGLEWDQKGSSFWAIKQYSTGAYGARFVFSGMVEPPQIAYDKAYFGIGTLTDKDDGFNNARDLTRNNKNFYIVVDILSTNALRLKGWDVSGSPGKPQAGLDLPGLKGDPKQASYVLRFDCDDNKVSPYGNILFILHGDSTNGYFLSLYYPSELPSWW